MIGLSRIWEASWDTHRFFLECKRLHIQCQFQEPSQILQQCFFNVFSKEHNWITLQGWCHSISCWPSSADLSTNHHRPNPHHLKIALFECLKFVKQSDFAMFLVESMLWLEDAGRVFRFLRCIKVSFCTVSSKDYITFCNTVFVPQNMTGQVCKGWCVNIPGWSSSSDLSKSHHRRDPHHLKMATWFCNIV